MPDLSRGRREGTNVDKGINPQTQTTSRRNHVLLGNATLDMSLRKAFSPSVWPSRRVGCQSNVFIFKPARSTTHFINLGVSFDQRHIHEAYRHQNLQLASRSLRVLTENFLFHTPNSSNKRDLLFRDPDTQRLLGQLLFVALRAVARHPPLTSSINRHFAIAVFPINKRSATLGIGRVHLHRFCSTQRIPHRW